ncbi:putative disease resistance RPP13-like protein 1 [Arachis stenosperma]|uniref:putative disease resistance RPP13-like protein 1 n=1 Tax=Arachis stenosperma TaxID=217475 RepID=UPI0025AB6CCB|nr:putative disease resistance RPP13-like protein 1 [Arachis stenosperma]
MDAIMELGFFSSTVSATLQLVKKELFVILGADEELKKLERTLLKVQVLFDSVKAMQHYPLDYKMQQLWLHDTRCVLLDAEDLMDEIALAISRFTPDDLIEGDEKQLRNSVLGSLKLNIPSSIVKMREQLEDIERKADANFMNELYRINQFQSISKLQSSSLVDASCVIGRENDMEEILSLLANDMTNENFSVIALVGMMGVGKTTLAQFVYNNDRVADNFELRIWISISGDEDAKRITRSIVEAVCEKSFESSDMDQIQVTLRKVLREKKVLIVLDGMCNEDENDWEILCLPFNVAAKGSKILVTTQSMLVSEMVATVPMYHVRTLSDQDCWRIIEKGAFSRLIPDDSKRSVLEEIGFKIAQKCNKLPLIAKMFGNVLRFNHDEKKWEAILKSKLWELPASRNILSAVKSSYDRLPSYLQRCFAYCTIFPPNHKFSRHELVKLWVSEGFIQQSGVRSAQEIGGEYFDILVQRSFFQLSPVDHGNHQVFRMHNLIHEFAEFVSDGLCIRVEDGMSSPISNFKDVRHASLICDDVQTEHLNIFSKCDRMRTLILFSKGGVTPVNIPNDFFGKINFSYLRALNLSFSKIREIPEIIGTAKHMRHLDVSSTSIKKLPESITNLNGMETLKLNHCIYLLEWPKNMKNLTNLQHLEIDLDTLKRMKSMPSELGKLINLQGLSAFMVAKEKGRRIEELKDMNYLHGSLCITKLENVSDATEAATANLQEKSYLDTLELQWTDAKDDREGVLAKLEPNEKIKYLTIEGYGGTLFPGWIGSPKFSKIEKIIIKNCICMVFPFLGHLPMLNDLHIEKISKLRYVDCEPKGDSPSYQSLRALTVCNMQDLKEWGVLQAGDMAKLEKIEFSECPELKCLPRGQLPSSVKCLIIRNCNNLKAQCMIPGSEDWNKIQSIPKVEID